MYAAEGIGLASQQVGRLQVTVIDVSPVKDRPSTMRINDEEVDPNDHMPMVLVNPTLEPSGEPIEGPEGCLSFPEIYKEIRRPESVKVSALDREGNPVAFECGGLLARAVQHETDHLNGILFIDRMSSLQKEEIRDELEALQAETKEKLKQGN